MNEENECGKCAGTISNGHMVVCEGICNKKYHLACSGIDEDAAKIVENNINVSFVCNLCTIFTPNGLFNKINEINLSVQNSQTSSDKKIEMMLKSQETLTTTVKVYLKQMISESKSTKTVLQENSSKIDVLTKKLQFVEYKIDKIADETSSYQYPRVIQSFKDFDKTLDKMAEVTLTTVESGLERQSQIVSQLNDTISEVIVSNRAIEDFAATTCDLLQAHQTDNITHEQLQNGVEVVLNRMEKIRKEDLQVVTKPKEKASQPQKSGKEPSKNNNNSTISVNKKNKRKSYSNEVSGVCKLPNGNVVITFENENPLEFKKKPTQRISNLKEKTNVSNKKSVTIADKVRNCNGTNQENRNSRGYSKPARAVENSTRTYSARSDFNQEDYVKVKIIGLSEKLEEKMLNHYLKEQNTLIDNGSYTKILKYEETTNRYNKYHKFNVLVEIEKRILEKLPPNKKININWDKCSVVEEIKVKRCFNCSGYNHRSDKCSNKVACPRCSGEHRLANCNSQEFQCINCLVYNDKLNMKLNTKHSALSINCEVFKRKMQLNKEILSGSK